MSTKPSKLQIELYYQSRKRIDPSFDRSDELAVGHISIAFVSCIIDGTSWRQTCLRLSERALVSPSASCHICLRHAALAERGK